MKSITTILKSLLETISMMADGLTRSGYDVSPVDEELAEKIAEKNAKEKR